MNTIPAIPTEYQGFRFRSRLEARWAVYFNALTLPWRYEAEAFELPSGKYLPDFYLPTVGGGRGIFVEVKPVEGTDLELRLCGELAVAFSRPVLMVNGSPIETQGEVDERDLVDSCGRQYGLFTGADDCDWPYLFCECPVCHRVGVEWCGRGERVCEGRHPMPNGFRDFTAFTPRMVACAREANMYRFWN